MSENHPEQDNQSLDARAAWAKERLSLQLTLIQREQELEKCRADLRAERERRGGLAGASTEVDRVRERARERDRQTDRQRKKERQTDKQTDRQTNREIAAGPIVSVSLFMVVFWFSEWMVLWMSLAWSSP